MKLTRILIYILHVYNKLSLKTIENTNEHKINENTIINFTGPINFLRGYYYAHNNMIMKKRVYSPELEYELKIEMIDDVIYFVRPSFRKPKVKKYEEWKDEEIKYVEGYHKIMSLLFQYNDQISVINNGKYSFYKFMDNEKVKNENKKLFAALLLIGEGVPIELKITKINKIKYLVLKEEEVSFELPLSFQTKDEEISYSSVQEIVKIFTTVFIKWPKFRNEADSAEEFSEGIYTMSPNFIIQSYLYELIEDKAENLIEIVEWCHKILKKYKNEYPEVYNRCFKSLEDKVENKDVINEYSEENYSEIEVYPCRSKIKVETLTLKKASKDLEMIENIKSNKVVLPFDDNNSLPKYGSVKLLETRNKGKPNKYSESETYSNCCEISIFSMLSLLFYDHKNKRYNTSHLNSETSKEMIEFFTKRTNPREIIYNGGFQQEWSDILVDLPCSEIEYVREKKTENNRKMSNELKSGMVNTLRVICSLCGLKKELIEIRDLEIRLSRITEKRDIIENIIERIFKKISVNNNYKIQVVNLHQTKTIKKYDFTGTVQLKYEKDKIFVASAKLVVLDNHQRVELWTKETQFSIRANALISKYKKDDCLIGELHNNLLYGYAAQNHKLDLENCVLKVLEAKNDSYISLCSHFGSILNHLNSITISDLNAIHIYLILRIRKIYDETKKIFNSEFVPFLFNRPSITFLAQYAKNSSESLFLFFLSLFNNIAVSVDLSQEINRKSLLMPLLLFDKECVYFEHIKIPKNSMIDLFHTPDILLLLLELSYSIVPDLWVMELFQEFINLAIEDFENGEELIFPDIFFFNDWGIMEEMLKAAVFIFTEYIKNKEKSHPSKKPHPFLFPVTPEWQKTFIYYDADKTIENIWLIFYLNCFDHCCYVESLDDFKSRIISKESNFYASCPNYIFLTFYVATQWLFKLEINNPVKILAILLNNATSVSDFSKLFYIYIKNLDFFGFFDLYNLVLNSTIKFYNVVKGTKFFRNNLIDTSDISKNQVYDKLIDYLLGYSNFLNQSIEFFNSNENYFLKKEKINKKIFKLKIGNLIFTKNIICDYIELIKNV